MEEISFNGSKLITKLKYGLKYPVLISTAIIKNQNKHLYYYNLILKEILTNDKKKIIDIIYKEENN